MFAGSARFEHSMARARGRRVNQSLAGVEVTELISSVDTFDVRFPTSRERDGSDAMNPFPDYSAAYIVLRTSAGAEGYGLIFTVGRGTEVQVAGVEALRPLVVGQPVDDLL